MHRKRSRAGRAREAARRIIRESPLSAEPLPRCPTPDELRALMDAADSAGARALAAARAITEKTPH